ncbi:MAG: hypothetical protein WBL31_10060 [Ilumatobacteraceae bacterium]
MNRRSASLAVRILLAIAVVAGLATVRALAAEAPTPPVYAATTAPTPTDDITVDTANPFLPEDQDLTACVGTLQRPGCGSSERGGWHQNLVAIAMVGGLLLVFGRVAWGVRRNRDRPEGNVASTP